jgi:thioredoxin-like negative regulator of GroEL
MLILTKTKYALAVYYSATNKPEQAIDEALGIIKIDKQYNDQAARKFLLQLSFPLFFLFSPFSFFISLPPIVSFSFLFDFPKVFEMLGSDHPATVKGRKRLSSLWFL